MYGTNIAGELVTNSQGTVIFSQYLNEAKNRASGVFQSIQAADGVAMAGNYLIMLRGTIVQLHWMQFQMQDDQSFLLDGHLITTEQQLTVEPGMKLIKAELSDTGLYLSFSLALRWKIIRYDTETQRTSSYSVPSVQLPQCLDVLVSETHANITLVCLNGDQVQALKSAPQRFSLDFMSLSLASTFGLPSHYFPC